jgi:predicted O-methyltransferase YrrM
MVACMRNRDMARRAQSSSDSIISRLKTRVKKLPPIRRLVEQRDGLLIERNHLLAQTDDLMARVTDLNESLNGKCAELGEAQSALGRYTNALLCAHALLAQFGKLPFVPNGHFYSPIPSQEEICRDRARIFSGMPTQIPGVDLNTDAQREFLNELIQYYQDLPFSSDRHDGLRYFYENTAYSYSDAIFLNGMLRHAKPKRVIEVGSGYSSCMLLDANERWFENSIECTFIEPYPDLLFSLLKDGDRERINVHAARLRDVDLSTFEKLEANDILFIDSTHVSKIGSEVNYAFFNVLPALKSGVYIHIHDVFYPLEYPKQWVDERRAWNEIYILRAFLQGNRDFEIVAVNTYLEEFHRGFFEANMPLCLKSPGGSIGLRKR